MLKKIINNIFAINYDDLVKANGHKRLVEFLIDEETRDTTLEAMVGKGGDKVLFALSQVLKNDRVDSVVWERIMDDMPRLVDTAYSGPMMNALEQRIDSVSREHVCTSLTRFHSSESQLLMRKLLKHKEERLKRAAINGITHGLALRQSYLTKSDMKLVRYILPGVELLRPSLRLDYKLLLGELQSSLNIRRGHQPNLVKLESLQYLAERAQSLAVADKVWAELWNQFKRTEFLISDVVGLGVKKTEIPRILDLLGELDRVDSIGLNRFKCRDRPDDYLKELAVEARQQYIAIKSVDSRKQTA